MNTHPPPERFLSSIEQAGIHVSHDQLATLGAFLALLLEVNQRMNLTAVTDPDEAWLRHVLDSLTLAPHLQDADRIADIGSGGGLPGIPLAIVNPGQAFTLIEATGKKANFLRQAAEQLELSNVQVRAERAEVLGRLPEHRAMYDLVTGRAVGALRVFVELAAPLARRGGRILAMKGRAHPDEIRDARRALAVLGLELRAVHHALPFSTEEGVLVEIRKQKETPRAYPRLPGVPRKKPL